MKPLRFLTRLLASTTAAGALMLGLSATAHQAQAADLTKVTLVYDWVTPDFELIPTAVAQAEGFYKDAGLDVSTVFPPNNSTTVRMLGSGTGDIGFDPVTDVAFAAAQGIPLISIAVYSQSNNCGLFGRPGEPVDLSTLKGKKIGVYTDSWTKAMMPYILKKAGIGENDVQQIIATDDDIPMLLTKKIDYATNCANYALADVVPTIKQEPTMLLGPAGGMPDVPVWDFTVMKAWGEAHPATVKAWLAATQKGMEWASAHPDEAVADLLKLYPASGDKAYNAVGWKATIPLLKGPNGYFVQTDAQWDGIAHALADTKQIDKVLPPSTYYTNDYLK
ncbi:ABC transporter substrate-binding protein [Acidisoma silvae]|uniref:ABC transporter substrate-binding protein n=1 Tax=Acidisoma silvae TaxID=2802396 RepID=A0A963YPF5_9PROT|nr:ABC transporter substrate-binding protein [Acidisoma silvae]MCB8874302.1 ABC transporter substrate-binding protein [Acidisoma silvae]